LNRLKWDGIRTREAAIAEIVDVWDRIPMDVINELCASFPCRVQMMREARGKTIQPLLSSQQKSVPTNYLPDRQHVVPLAIWTEDEDARLMGIPDANPNMSWDRLAAHFPGQSVPSIRLRWRVLRTQALNSLNEEA
jgi:hypothetical protein